MKTRNDDFFLLNIVDALNDIVLYTSLEHDVFISEKMRQDAVERKFEILGEAAKNLSEAFREKHPDIPWSHMARFRDFLSHHYFGIDQEAIWEISQKDMKKRLKKNLQFDEYPATKKSENIP